MNRSRFSEAIYSGVVPPLAAMPGGRSGGAAQVQHGARWVMVSGMGGGAKGPHGGLPENVFTLALNTPGKPFSWNGHWYYVGDGPVAGIHTYVYEWGTPGSVGVGAVTHPSGGQAAQQFQPGRWVKVLGAGGWGAGVLEQLDNMAFQNGTWVPGHYVATSTFDNTKWSADLTATGNPSRPFYLIYHVWVPSGGSPPSYATLGAPMTLAGCPMGVECTAGHEIDHQYHGGTTGAPRHMEDHWLALPMNQIPVGVRAQLAYAQSWATHWAEHKWWATDGRGNYYTYLTQGSPDTTMGSPLGQAGALDPTACCNSNALWGMAGAIALLAVAHGAYAYTQKKRR